MSGDSARFHLALPFPVGQASGTSGKQTPIGQTFADGSVHIGQLGPAAALGIQGDLGADQILLHARGSHTAGSGLSLENTTTDGKRWDLVATGSANGEGPGKLLFYQGTLGDVMALTTNGWLGIGTASPSALLGLQGHAGADQILMHARGSHAAGSWLSLENTATGGNRWDFISTGPANGEGAGKLLLRQSAVGSVLTLTTNGSVGVNNTSPQAALDLVTHAADQYAVNLKNVAANGWTIISLMDGAGRFGNIDYNYGTLIDGYDNIVCPQIGFYNSRGAYFVLRELPGGYSNPGRVDCNVSLYPLGLYERSDRNLKTDIEAVNSTEVLEGVLSLPVSTWAFTNAVNTRHIGPMAQDFHAAFGLGQDDKTIGPRDANGVALAAIQGLNQKLEVKNAALEKEVAELKALVQTLAAKVNGGGQ